MSALIVDLRPVRNALQQLQRSGLDAARQLCVDRVVDEIRAGRSGFSVARDLMTQRMASDAASTKGSKS